MAGAKLSSAAAVLGYPVFLGIGLGWSLTYLVTAAQLSAPPHLIAITSGILLAIRSFGGSVALAICEHSFYGILTICTNINRYRHLQLKPLETPWARHCSCCPSIGTSSNPARGFYRRAGWQRPGSVVSDSGCHASDHRSWSTCFARRIFCKL